MIKKKYMQPALEISQAEAMEVLAVSLTGVNSSGLGDDDNVNIDGDDLDGDPWEDAL